MMYAHHGSHAMKIFVGGVVCIVGLGQHQTHEMLGRVADRLDSFKPGLFIHQQRQGLGGEEWLV